MKFFFFDIFKVILKLFKNMLHQQQQQQQHNH